MQFQQFFQEQNVIGLVELLDIDGVGSVKAKVDSGNQGFNVLHANDIRVNDKGWVSFKTVNGKTLEKEVKDRIIINTGSGHKEERFVVALDVKIGSRFFKNIPFSLGDRADNDNPVLIGEPFIKQLNALIDVNKKTMVEGVYQVIYTNSSDNLSTKLTQPFYTELELKAVVGELNLNLKTDRKASIVINPLNNQPILKLKRLDEGIVGDTHLINIILNQIKPIVKKYIKRDKQLSSSEKLAFIRSLNKRCQRHSIKFILSGYIETTVTGVIQVPINNLSTASSMSFLRSLYHILIHEEVHQQQIRRAHRHNKGRSKMFAKAERMTFKDPINRTGIDIPSYHSIPQEVMAYAKSYVMHEVDNGKNRQQILNQLRRANYKNASGYLLKYLDLFGIDHPTTRNFIKNATLYTQQLTEQHQNNLDKRISNTEEEIDNLENEYDKLNLLKQDTSVVVESIRKHHSYLEQCRRVKRQYLKLSSDVKVALR